ncbi:hypothetical protein BS17DRAFT_857563 [Gyrodon lividus]|nr:hypothetical protein BS17DRAFT_857563 [Gyrodon lividus]
MAIRALIDFRYLTQAPLFTTQSLERVKRALQEFHDNKDAIVHHGAWTNWEIPKLELLQSVVPSIIQSGAVIQWTADVTKHAHVQEIQVPAHSGNNQNYYSQIARHLDRLDKCFCFDLATYIQEHVDQAEDDDSAEDDNLEGHEPDTETRALVDYATPTCPIIDYFTISLAILQGSYPSAPRPFRTFTTATTAFHLVTKPSLRMTVAEASIEYGLPDLTSALSRFLAQQNDDSALVPSDKLQIWQKVRMSYHNHEILELPQTLHAIPPSSANLHGQYDPVIVSDEPQSDWPECGLVGHSVVQLHIIFCPLHTDFFAAYIQRFNIVPQCNPMNVSPVSGMHMLKRAVWANGQQIGKVIPLTFICSPAHLIPHFGTEAHLCLTKLSSYELSSKFWLNKYWSKEFYYALSLM